MRLADLDPHFIKRLVDQPGVVHQSVGTLAEADGVRFLCPVCYKNNSGPAGTHGIICWFVGKVPDAATPGPGRWTPQGTGLHDLTFVPGNPPRLCSVALTGDGCKAHFHIVNGEIRF